MEVVAYVGIVISSFIFGVALGGFLENRRLTVLDRLSTLERVTQEIFVPLADKIEEMSTSEVPECDMCQDLTTTMKIPKIERGTHAEES
tara:strand:+ start:265 stop:531 length:267 start_codon:yes stop_codon:yes gene_type:complete